MQRIISIFIIMAAAFIIWAPPVFSQTDELFSGIVIDQETAEPFKLVALIMEIHKDVQPLYVVVAEKNILVTQFKISNTITHTRLINRDGSEIQMSDLEIGQRVIVNGLKLPDETLVGNSIQVKPK